MAAQSAFKSMQGETAAAQKIVPGEQRHGRAGREGSLQGDGFHGDERLRLLLDMNHIGPKLTQNLRDSPRIVQVSHMGTCQPSFQRHHFLATKRRVKLTVREVKSVTPAAWDQEPDFRAEPLQGYILFLIVGQQKRMADHQQSHGLSPIGFSFVLPNMLNKKPSASAAL